MRTPDFAFGVLFPTEGCFVGSSGRHRQKLVSKTLRGRTVLLITAGVALLAAAAATLILVQPGPSAAKTEAGAAPTAPRVAPRAGRDLTRTPLASPSSSPTKAKPKKKKKPKPTERVMSTGRCQASFYGTGQTTASGESFNPNELTAANKTLPMGTRVRVTNLANGRSVTVRINDRGPFVAGRCLDLSTAAMRAVGGMGSGVISVKYAVLSKR